MLGRRPPPSSDSPGARRHVTGVASAGGPIAPSYTPWRHISPPVLHEALLANLVQRTPAVVLFPDALDTRVEVGTSRPRARAGAVVARRAPNVCRAYDCRLLAPPPRHLARMPSALSDAARSFVRLVHQLQQLPWVGVLRRESDLAAAEPRVRYSTAAELSACSSGGDSEGLGDVTSRHAPPAVRTSEPGPARTPRPCPGCKLSATPEN